MIKRYNQILEIVSKKKIVPMSELCERFDVSYDSIRRDLIILEKDGLITRRKGIVYATPNKALAYKSLNSSEAKDRIVRYAAGLINDNQLVYIDSGSTTLGIYKYITAKNITVVTANVSLGLKLNQKGIKTFLLPGRYDPRHDSISGTIAAKYISKFFFDVAILCTSAIDIQTGYTVNSEASCELKREAAKLSRKQYILSDSSKYGKHCICKIADLYFGTLITDENNGYLPSDMKIIEVNKVYENES